jgi:capsular polysaccharide transport system permease protein
MTQDRLQPQHDRLQALKAEEIGPASVRRLDRWNGQVANFGRALARPVRAISKTGFRGRTRLSRYSVSFLFFVLLPALCSAFYFIFLAADQYVAETRFAVRSIQFDSGSDPASTSVLGSLAVPVMADQDTYILADYIRSRSIVDELQKTIDLRAIFSRPEADFWARLKTDATIDDLVSYWRRMVDVYIDRPSGIVTVDIRAFRPADALLLSKAVLAASESLINGVSARARQDAMRTAEEEVRRNEAKVRDALVALRAFRDREGFISPTAEATSTSTLLMQVMSEKIKLQNDLFVASHAMSADAPTVQTLRSRLENMDRQIEELKAQLASNSPQEDTVSKALVKFEELEVQRTFAEKLYEISQNALERARLRAERQNIYVNPFVEPTLPQEATYPERIALSCIIPVVLLVIWGIFALIIAAIEDHRV